MPDALMANFPIPDTALNTHIGVLGKTGAGKSYTARGLAERLLSMRRQVVIVDPTGAWYGLRTGFNIPIFGGRQGDVEINDLAGEAVAGVIVEQNTSGIIDLSLMTANGQKRFMRDFAHRLRKKPPGALYLFLDEADEFLPQEKVKGAGVGTDLNLFGDLKWMVRRGRLNGFRVTMITQRPAEIAKAVLTQIETLVAHRLTAPQDRRAVEEWVKGHADPDAHREVLASLASLEKGVAWVWAPDLGILSKSKMPPITTFDSGRTPEPGEAELTPPALADLDLSAIKASLATVEAEAKSNDPRALKAEVARLSRELLKAQRATVPAPPAPPPKQVITNTADLEAARKDGVREGIARAQQALAALGEGKPLARPKASAPADFERVVAEPSAVTVADGLTGPQQRILNALAWWKAFGIDQPTNEQVAFVAGYSPTSGGYANPRGALKAIGFLDYPSPGKLTLTAAGEEKADAPDAPPTTEEMHRRIMGKLSVPQQRILAPVMEAYPESLTNQEAADKAGYSPTSGGYANPRGSLKSLNLITYPSPGSLRAADWMFP